MNVVLRLTEAAVDFLWWGGVVYGLVGGLGLQNQFHVQPNNCVEVVLQCIVVGVVTIIAKC